MTALLHSIILPNGDVLDLTPPAGWTYDEDGRLVQVSA